MDIRIPRVNLHVPTELSRFTSPREPGSIRHNWQAIAQGQQRSSDTTNQNGQFLQGLNKALQPRPMALGVMHPFKLYQLPYQYRTTPLADPSTAWRAFRVRNGFLLNSTFDLTGASVVTGTDTIDQPYYDVFATQADGTPISGVTDIIVPSGELFYWFWIDVATTQVCYGTDPTSPDHGPAWSSFPTADADHVMIGYVDTDTLSDICRAIPRQFQYTDVEAIGGGSGSGISAFTISTTVNTNYWVCTKVSDSSTVNVAKPGKLRNSITSATIDGNSWTYTYTNTVERTATNGSYSEYQRISPRVLAGDLIFAYLTTAAETGVSTVLWQDLNVNGCAWSPNVDQTAP